MARTMKRPTLASAVSLAIAALAGASSVLLAQAAQAPTARGGAAGGTVATGGAVTTAGTMKPGHDRVPPYRAPSPYLSAAAIQTGLNQLDPKLVASRTGGAIPIAPDKAPGVVRRRMKGPQYAITHTRALEYIIVTKGTATMVTGGTLVPPTIDSDPYPIEDPNQLVRTEAGVKDGLARRIGPGDVLVNLPGTPHWLSEIDDTIEYVEIQIPNVDPAPGLERAEMKAKAPAGSQGGR